MCERNVSGVLKPPFTSAAKPLSFHCSCCSLGRGDVTIGALQMSNRFCQLPRCCSWCSTTEQVAQPLVYTTVEQVFHAALYSVSSLLRAAPLGRYRAPSIPSPGEEEAEPISGRSVREIQWVPNPARCTGVTCSGAILLWNLEDGLKVSELWVFTVNEVDA